LNIPTALYYTPDESRQLVALAGFSGAAAAALFLRLGLSATEMVDLSLQRWGLDVE
jgi:hypothetical protein